MREPIRRPVTVQAAALGEIRLRLSTGAFSPGEYIRPKVIADELGHSRLIVREALRVLEGEGRIVHVPHRGYFVANLDARSLNEIFRMRELLETEALRKGLPKVRSDHLDGMRSALENLKRLDPNSEIAAFSQTHRDFHFYPMLAAGMPRLLRHIRMLWDELDSYRMNSEAEAVLDRRLRDRHQQFLAAVERRDVDAVVHQARHARDLAANRLAEPLRDLVPGLPYPSTDGRSVSGRSGVASTSARPL